MRYPRPRQREFADAMCERHPRAVDYLEQAPILLVAVSESSHRYARTTHHHKSSTPPLNGEAFERALTEWRQLVTLGWRLPKVMAHYKIARQWRALAPSACTSAAWWPVVMTSRLLDGATLAAAMPLKAAPQIRWIKAQRNWYQRMLERNRAVTQQGLDHELAYVKWAAVAFGRGPFNCRTMPAAAGDLADFAIARGPAFNTSWDMLQAADACGLWHQQLNAEQEGQFANDPPVDYAPFPDVFLARTGHQVVALRTRESLWREGRAMKHCVFDYWWSVLGGSSRIFSVRRATGEPICTLELRHKGTVLTYDTPDGVLQTIERDSQRWWPAQSQGFRAHHSQPRPPQPEEAAEPIQQFLVAHCPGWPS